MASERYPAPSDLVNTGKNGYDQKKDESKPEGNKKSFICPYKECGKRFTESGNLKTHIRIHVRRRSNGRLGNGPSRALTKAAARASSPRDTSRATS